MLDFIKAWFQRGPGPRPQPGQTLHRGRHYTFNEDSRRVLERARMEAIHAGRRVITPTHLLLALLHPLSGTAPAFARLGIDPDALRDGLGERSTGRRRPSTGVLPYDNAAKRSLVWAMAESVAMRDPEVGPGHLLAGILRAGRSDAARALADAGVTLPRLRAALWPDGPDREN